MNSKAERVAILVAAIKGGDCRKMSLIHLCEVCLIKSATARVEELCGVLIAYVCDDCWDAANVIVKEKKEA